MTCQPDTGAPDPGEGEGPGEGEDRGEAEERGEAEGRGAAEDRRLVERYLDGRREEAFRALYRRHAPALWPLTLRLCRGREDEAEEVVQETWLRAARGLAGFRRDAALRTWLVGIAMNVVRERVRSRARRERREGAAVRRAEAAGEADVDVAAVDRVALVRALDGLSHRLRVAVLLHDVHGYTHEEIAGMVGIEPGSSRARVSRGRAALRAILAERGSG